MLMSVSTDEKRSRDGVHIFYRREAEVLNVRLMYDESEGFEDSYVV